jgi:hypothetical protein
MSSEVTELIAALRAGTMTLDEVAERFRRRHWPRTRKARPETYLAMAAQASEDPEPDVPGSYNEVTAAYYRREISSEQYRVLSDAVAESINAEARAREQGQAE